MKKKLLLLTISVSQLGAFAQSSEGENSTTNRILDLLPAPTNLISPYAEGAEKRLDNQFYFNSNGFIFNGGAGTIPAGPFTFKLNNTTKYTSLNNPPPAGDYMLGGAWANGKWYAVVYPANNLITVDTTTGARTVVGPMSPGSQIWSGMSYDVVGGVMYAVSVASSGSATTTLHTINLATGAPTQVGVAAGVNLINLAANKAGNLYSVDIAADNFGSVNKTTGAFTLIGPVGFNASYAQDMEFDLSTDTCFWACYNVTATAAELRVVDITTGTSTLIGAFSPSAQVLGFAIAAGHVVGIPSFEKGSSVRVKAYPNPFNGQTDITFVLPQAEKATLEIMDVCGKRVSTLINEELTEGEHTIGLNATGLLPGIYFCQLRISSGIQTTKLIRVE